MVRFGEEICHTVAIIEDEDTGGGVGARFYLTDSISIGARYDKLGDDETIAAGARFEL